MGGAYLLLAAAAQSGCTLDRVGGLHAPCTHDDDCDDGLPCTDDFCSDDGVCNANPADNSIYLVQQPFDCRNMVCQNGFEIAVPEDDAPPSTPCLDAYCDGTDLVETPKGDGDVCEVGQGSGVCEGGECLIECDADNFLTVCNDQEDCTDDTCNFNTGTCVNDPIPDQPHPVIAQVVGDCRIALCVGGYPVLDHIDDADLPEDGNDCTDDVCSEGQPANNDLPEDTPCGAGDALFCNQTGTCVGCNEPDQCGGSDTTCRWRTCSPSGECGTQDAGTNVNCDDGVFCNGDGANDPGADKCDGNGYCAVHTGNPCDGPDGDGDCSEMCRENQDDCNGNDQNGLICNDGAFCNGLDACNSGSCSQHNGDPCNGPDGDSNCNESCDEGNNNCLAYDGNGASCGDGTWCNGTDTCGGGSCSNHTGDPCDGPNDGDADCTETCVEGNPGNCNGNDGNGTGCDDG
ncbi:MAG: hypothetical protein JRI68_26740, partial [Deltaproteobacteria bacterium]|nr:hypothetical protein [Deltaproteobacteria bacterium]